MSQPRLVATSVPAEPDAAVLVLHGGGSRRDSAMVSPTQLSVLRMVPIARRLARAGRGRLAVFRLLNSTRGWDTRHTPVDDTIWALEQVRERLGDLPFGLVGHSLGGRAALLAGAQPGVRTVVALNPYVLAEDAVDLAGRSVLVVHGSADRVAAPRRAEELTRRMMRTADVSHIEVTDARHAMLRRGGTFERAATDFVDATLLGRRDGVAAPVAEVLAGERWVTA